MYRLMVRLPVPQRARRPHWRGRWQGRHLLHRQSASHLQALHIRREQAASEGIVPRPERAAPEEEQYEESETEESKTED